KLNARQRRENAVFYARRGVDLSGKRVLLVDDIVTTGATMGSAAFALRGIGAKEIVGVCFAIAFKDPYVPFEKPPYQQ
ncbi:MAG: phosphoribosyltransferase, partial [Clostridia bacterium]|nr:phosphoribosyltransferase [Clostridia bacterium]